MQNTPGPMCPYGAMGYPTGPTGSVGYPIAQLKCNHNHWMTLPDKLAEANLYDLIIDSIQVESIFDVEQMSCKATQISEIVDKLSLSSCIILLDSIDIPNNLIRRIGHMGNILLMYFMYNNTQNLTLDSTLKNLLISKLTYFDRFPFYDYRTEQDSQCVIKSNKIERIWKSEDRSKCGTLSNLPLGVFIDILSFVDPLSKQMLFFTCKSFDVCLKDFPNEFKLLRLVNTKCKEVYVNDNILKILSPRTVPIEEKGWMCMLIGSSKGKFVISEYYLKWKIWSHSLQIEKWLKGDFTPLERESMMFKGQPFPKEHNITNLGHVPLSDILEGQSLFSYLTSLNIFSEHKELYSVEKASKRMPLHLKIEEIMEISREFDLIQKLWNERPIEEVLTDAHNDAMEK